MKIAIVDDDYTCIQKIKKVLQKFEDSLTIETFQSGEDFYKNVSCFNYVCLDIELGDIDGIELAKKISNFQIKIIFITHYSQRMIEAFGVNVVKFILKDNMEEELYKFINKELDENVDYLTINLYDQLFNLQFCNIIKIKYYLRDVIFYLNNGEQIKIKENTLKLFKEQLNDSFFQINRDTIINLNYAKTIDNRYLYLDKYKEVVSRRKVRDLKIKLIERKLNHGYSR